MTNQEIIKKRFEAFRQGVRTCGNLALCDQMETTLNQSLGLHEQLEGGFHRHHLTESDSHGWAVTDGGALVGSGSSKLSMPNENGSAEDDAIEEASVGTGQMAVFSAVMVNPFEGGHERTDKMPDEEYEGREPHDSIRFEAKLQELLKTSLKVNLPWMFKKNVNAIRQ